MASPMGVLVGSPVVGGAMFLGGTALRGAARLMNKGKRVYTINDDGSK